MFLCGLFFFFRIPSLLSHYVAYTYDQGRDFIAGANIVINRDLPFIGPTTGISGLFHGAWWYYLLSIPYIIFRGAPIGYYWFNFFIQFSLFVVFLFFLKRTFGQAVALFIGLVVASAPYFTFMSLFVGNNSMVLPALLLFLIGNYNVLTQKSTSPLIYLMLGLSLGFVGEFELSFGILLIPLYFLGILIFQKLRAYYFQKKGFMFMLGIGIAFTPRLLFELKNSFSQTKILLSFFLHPKLYNNPAPYLNRLSERWILFQQYYFDLFSNRIIAYLFLFAFFSFLAIALASAIRKKHKLGTPFFFYLYLLGGLFFLSTLYKDFFWKNYYEGIQYIFIFLMVACIGEFVAHTYLRLKRNVLYILIVALALSTGYDIVRSYSSKIPFDGLQVQEQVAQYLLNRTRSTDRYCLRIYTPSVIPHTYNYILLVHNQKPSSEWVDGKCWFIIEADSFAQRREDWIETNRPKDKHSVTIKKIKDVEIRYYEVQK